MKQRLFVMFVLVGLLAAACGPQPAPTPDGSVPPVVVDDFAIIAEGRLRPQQFVDLAFSSSGVIAEVLVAEGDSVAAEGVIARLESSVSLNAQVSSARLELMNAEQALRDLREAAVFEAAQAQYDMVAAREEIRLAEKDLRNVMNPVGEAVTDRVADAERALLDAERNAEKTDLGALALALEAAEDVLEEKTDQLNDVKTEQAKCPQCIVLYAAATGRFIELPDAEKEYQDALEAYRVAELNYQQALSGTDHAVEEAREELEDARADLAAAERGPEDYRVALAEGKLALAQARLADAERRYSEVESGADPEKVALAQARIEAAQAQLAAAEDALAKAELRAPFAGTIASLKLKAGEQAAAGAPLVTLVDFSTWIVETDNLTEIEVVKIAPGQGATIVFDALPETELHGTVATISNVFEEKRGDITYTAKIRLDQAEAALRWGMTAEITFDQ
jgi:multidrug resistance efflux pump